MTPVPLSPDAGASRDVAVVPLEFKTEEVSDGKGGFSQVDWVVLVKKGTNGQTTEKKVEQIKKYEPHIWAVVKPYYEHWKTGQEEPTSGTPLSAWPGCTRSQAEILKQLHIRTVEDVVGMNDAAGERFGSGWRALRERAKAFLEAKTSVAAQADEVVKLRDDNRVLKDRLTELEAAFERMNPVPMQAKGKKAS